MGVIIKVLISIVLTLITCIFVFEVVSLRLMVTDNQQSESEIISVHAKFNRPIDLIVKNK